MKGRGDRHLRVAERIRQEVCLLLLNRIKDPGLLGATVTEVTVSADLRCARIRYSVLGGEEERRRAAEGWHRCAGFIRHELGKGLDLRFVPELDFCYDESYEGDARLLALLNEVGKEKPGAQ